VDYDFPCGSRPRSAGDPPPGLEDVGDRRAAYGGVYFDRCARGLPIHCGEPGKGARP